MAGESIVAVTAGSGLKLHTWNRTIGANSIEDEFMLPGEFPYASYTVIGAGVSTATAASHMLQIMAGASLNVRIRRIRIKERAAPGAATAVGFQLIRLTTAGTGGTAITPGKLDTADGAAGAAGMTLPTVKGTEGVVVWEEALQTSALPPAAPVLFEWVQLANSKPIIIPAGVANGLALKNTSGLAACTVDIDVEIVETAFV